MSKLSMTKLKLQCENPDCMKKYFGYIHTSIHMIGKDQYPLCPHCGSKIAARDRNGEVIIEHGTINQPLTIRCKRTLLSYEAGL